MRGERITQGRLRDGGEVAARCVFQNICAMLNLSEAERAAAAENIKVTCVYKGTTVQDAPLHSQQAVTYEWSVNDNGPFEHKSCVNKTVGTPKYAPPPHILSSMSFVLPPCMHIFGSPRQMDFAWKGNVPQDELSKAGQDGAHLAPPPAHGR